MLKIEGIFDVVNAFTAVYLIFNSWQISSPFVPYYFFKFILVESVIFILVTL